MTRWFPVRASRLHRRQLIVGSTEIRSATLLPFFDRSGKVEHVLLVDSNSSELQTISLATTRICIPLLGAIRVEGTSRPLTEDAIQRLALFWHYDPWWLLRDQRFAFDGAVVILTRTNCAESFHRRPISISFSRRLTTLKWLTYGSASNGCEFKRFRPEMLPKHNAEAPSIKPSKHGGGGWQLAPFWRGPSEKTTFRPVGSVFRATPRQGPPSL